MNPEYIVTAGSAHRGGEWVVRYTVTARYGASLVTEAASVTGDEVITFLGARGITTADATRMIVDASHAMAVRAERDAEAIRLLRAGAMP